MSVVEQKIEIAVPIETVWATIMDPNRFDDWVTIHKSVSNVSSDPSAPGATMDQVMAMRGMTFKVHWTLAEVDVPRLAVWEGRGPVRSKAVIRYELTDGRDGAPTCFHYLNDFSSPGGPLGAAAGKFIVGAASEREARRSLERLKALLEAR